MVAASSASAWVTCPHCEEYVPNGAFCSFCSLPLGGTLSDLFPEAGRVATHAETATLPPAEEPALLVELLQPETKEAPGSGVAPEPPAGGKRLSLLRRREEKRKSATTSTTAAPDPATTATPSRLLPEPTQADGTPRAQKQMLTLPPSLLAPTTHIEGVAAAPSTTDEDPDDGFDERTMLRPPRSARAALHRYLLFSTGLRVPVTGEGVVGRAPVVDDSVTRVVQITDMGRELSRTHFTFGVDDDGVWVMDRSSANGTWAIDWAGVPAGQLTPETRYTLAPGDVFECGGIRISLHVQGDDR